MAYNVVYRLKALCVMGAISNMMNMFNYMFPMFIYSGVNLCWPMLHFKHSHENHRNSIGIPFQCYLVRARLTTLLS